LAEERLQEWVPTCSWNSVGWYFIFYVYQIARGFGKLQEVNKKRDCAVRVGSSESRTGKQDSSADSGAEGRHRSSLSPLGWLLNFFLQTNEDAVLANICDELLNKVAKWRTQRLVTQSVQKW
jgi:hypothetical protein